MIQVKSGWHWNLKFLHIAQLTIPSNEWGWLPPNIVYVGVYAPFIRLMHYIVLKRLIIIIILMQKRATLFKINLKLSRRVTREIRGRFQFSVICYRGWTIIGEFSALLVLFAFLFFSNFGRLNFHALFCFWNQWSTQNIIHKNYLILIYR